MVKMLFKKYYFYRSDVQTKSLKPYKTLAAHLGINIRDNLNSAITTLQSWRYATGMSLTCGIEDEVLINEV
jgi:hypothetical protein